MKQAIARALALMLILMTLCPAAFAGKADEAAFSAALEALQTPDEAALAAGRMALRLGDTVVFPSVSAGVVPYDETESVPLPTPEGPFESADAAVVAVDDAGRMTALAEGETQVTYHAPSGDVTLTVSVSAEAMPRVIENLIWVAQNEYFSTQRAKLPKWNKYAKWYYGKKNEVGWCSVFTIWCANAAGGNPIRGEELPADTSGQVMLLREGYPSNQYEGFFSQGRFVDAPKPGYLVIFADVTNAYRTSHIGIVTDAEDRGDGVYLVRTVEGNMSSTVKGYCFLYDSKLSNAAVGDERDRKIARNMSVVPEDEQTDPLLWQYKLRDAFEVFGFCATW